MSTKFQYNIEQESQDIISRKNTPENMTSNTASISTSSSSSTSSSPQPPLSLSKHEEVKSTEENLKSCVANKQQTVRHSLTNTNRTPVYYLSRGNNSQL
ncbi:unnamed protein product [Trichobilharzia regenti]|nr:unnamed protein product [Trichobilharzia regenti]